MHILIFNYRPGVKEKMCTHEMNVSGICAQHYCPLANSRYATITESKGKIYLCIKTPERAHMPNQWWEKILLDKKPETSIALIKQQLAWWHPKQIRRCIMRYLTIRRMLRRMRKIRTADL